MNRPQDQILHFQKHRCVKTILEGSYVLVFLNLGFSMQTYVFTILVVWMNKQFFHHFCCIHPQRITMNKIENIDCALIFRK